MPRTNVVRPDGSVASVEESQVAALEKLGYRREQAPETETRVGRELTEAYYDTPGQKAIAFGEGVAGGVTLGLAELALDDQASREREEHLGGWKLGGEVIGTVATALATGGTSTGAQVARATPAGAALVFGEKAAAKIASPIARAAAANAIEGGISSGAITAAKVLTDNDPDTIESFASEVGLGTLFGIGTGALVGGGMQAAGGLGKRAAERIERRIGQASGDDLVAGPAGVRAADEARLRFDEADLGITRERAQIDELLAAKEAQLEKARALVDGDEPTYSDLIEEALRRQAAGENIPNSYIARLGAEMADENPPTPHDWLLSGGPVPSDLPKVGPKIKRARGEVGVPKPEPQVKVEGPQVEAKTGAGKGLARGSDPKAADKTGVLQPQDVPVLRSGDRGEFKIDYPGLRGGDGPSPYAADALRQGKFAGRSSAEDAARPVRGPDSMAGLGDDGQHVIDGARAELAAKYGPQGKFGNAFPPRAPDIEPRGGTQATGAGKIAARQAEAAQPPAKGTPGPALKAIDDMEALEKEVMDLGAKSTNLLFKQKRLNEARALLATPQGLQSLSAAGLREMLDIISDASPTAHSGLRQVWGRFVDKDLAGLTPEDIASLSKTRAKMWEGLDERDVPILAAWTRLQSPGKLFPGDTVKPSYKPVPWQEEGRASRLAGRAFKYLGGRAVKGAIGGGFGAYALGWSAADAAWSGKLSGMLRGAKVAVKQRVDHGLARLAVLDGKRAIPGAAIGPVGAAISAKDYEESAKEIHSLAGAGGREALYAATANLRAIDPVLADGIVEDGMRRVSYLAKALPKPPPSGVFRSTRWTPTDVDRAKLSGIFRAVEDPPFAVEQMARGRLTPSVAAAFRETSPSLYASVATALVDFANANPDAPPSVRRQVAVMLGAPADELQLYTAQLQAAFVAEPGDMGPAVTAKPPQNLPTQAQTLTER